MAKQRILTQGNKKPQEGWTWRPTVSMWFLLISGPNNTKLVFLLKYFKILSSKSSSCLIEKPRTEKVIGVELDCSKLWNVMTTKDNLK